MADTMAPDLGERRTRLRSAGAILLWWVLPGLAVATVIAYIATAIILGVNPPVVPVEGTSMRPALTAGDLVFLEAVNPATLRKGDIIAVHVPAIDVQQYHVPPTVVHRIIKISHAAQGLTFQTKGDNNPGPDIFTTQSGAIVGKMIGSVPGLGYPILFLRSTQGEIFLGAAALIALVYFLIGVFEERHEHTAGTTVGLQTILAETQQLKRLIEEIEPLSGYERPDAPTRAPPPAPPPVPAQAGPAVSQPTEPIPPSLAALTDEVRSSGERSRETAETMHELVGAIGEYGEHLRSHTAVMQNLAETTGNLERATGELAGRTAAGGPGAGGPQLPSTLHVYSSRRPKMLANIIAELRSPALERSFRGYAVQPVERLLAQAAAALEDLETDREQLHARLEAAEQQLAHYRQLEEETRAALLAAERKALELSSDLDRKAEQMLGQLRSGAGEIIAQALEAALADGQAAPPRPGASGTVGSAPVPEERSLRAMLVRARESWRAATVQPPPRQRPDQPR